MGVYFLVSVVRFLNFEICRIVWVLAWSISRFGRLILILGRQILVRVVVLVVYFVFWFFGSSYRYRFWGGGQSFLVNFSFVVFQQAVAVRVISFSVRFLFLRCCYLWSVVLSCFVGLGGVQESSLSLFLGEVLRRDIYYLSVKFQGCWNCIFFLSIVGCLLDSVFRKC